MFSVFRLVDKLPRPAEHPIENFYTLIFAELEENPSLEAHITEITHYKEKNHFEHEFLIATVAHNERIYLLRLERSTPIRPHRTWSEKLLQTSSSIMPALDTVRVASSLHMITSGMNRGDSYPVSTLTISKTTKKPYSLKDLCLILSFFPAFSPKYKLREEQCYWFCNVVLSAVQLGCGGDAVLVEEEGSERAGKFGGLSVKLSAHVRKVFLDAYSAVGHLQSLEVLMREPKEDEAIISTLVGMLDVPSDEAKTRAVTTLMQLSQLFPRCRPLIMLNGGAVKLMRSLATASPTLRHIILVTLQSLIDDRYISNSENDEILSAHVTTHFLTATDPALQGIAISTFVETISMSEGASKYAFESGAVAPLARLLSSSHSACHIQALRALRTFIEKYEWNAKDQIYLQENMLDLVHLLSLRSTSPGQMDAIFIFTKAVQWPLPPRLAKPTSASNLTLALVDLLTCKLAEVQVMAAEAITLLPRATYRHFTSPPIQLLSIMLSSEEPKVTSSAITTLGAILDAVDRGSNAETWCPCITPLVGLLSAGRSEIRQQAVILLSRILGAYKSLNREAVQSGCIPHLVRLLWSQEPLVQLRIVEALYEFSISLEPTAFVTEMMEADCIRPLIYILVPGSKEVISHTLAILKHLVQSESACRDVCKLGGIQSLRFLVSSKDFTAGVVADATAVLHHVERSISYNEELNQADSSEAVAGTSSLNPLLAKCGPFVYAVRMAERNVEDDHAPKTTGFQLQHIMETFRE